MNEWITAIVGMIGALAFMVIHDDLSPAKHLETRIQEWRDHRKARRDFPRARVRRER